MVLDTPVSNRANPAYEGEAGADTTDKVFLLSVEEVEKYLAGSDNAKAPLTENMKNKEVYFSGEFDYEQMGSWLFRTGGASGDPVSFVDPSGKVNQEGVPVNAGYIGLRPAMWIDLGIEE